MNSSQTQSALTSLGMVLAAVFAVLVATGKLTADQSSMLQSEILAAVSAVVTLGFAVWKLIPHSNANKTKAAAAIPGVNIGVSAMAPPSVLAVANDPTVKNVNTI